MCVIVWAWNTAKQLRQLTQVYVKGQEAYWSSHSSIKDLKPLPPLHFGAPGRLWGDKRPLRFLIRTLSILWSVLPIVKRLHNTQEEKECCSHMKNWCFQLCVVFSFYFLNLFIHSCSLAWIQIHIITCSFSIKYFQMFLCEQRNISLMYVTFQLRKFRPLNGFRFFLWLCNVKITDVQQFSYRQLKLLLVCWCALLRRWNHLNAFKWFWMAITVNSVYEVRFVIISSASEQVLKWCN